MKRLFGCLMSLIVMMSITCFVLSNDAFAGPAYDWKIPDNVRIVQNDPVDGVRTFSSIGAALNSITDASASNPYEIIVMPGTYGGATLKAYVTISGLDKETTIIQGNFGLTEVGPAYLKNLTIQYSSQYTAAVWYGGTLTITNCDISGENVYAEYAGLTIKESVINTWVNAYSAANVKISESTVIGNGTYGVRVGSNDGATLEIENSDIEGPIVIQNGITSCAITKSKIDDGVLPGMSTCKIVHSYDGNFDPITNQ